MAVPKSKQSHSRTAKRRAQRDLEPEHQRLPRCHSRDGPSVCPYAAPTPAARWWLKTTTRARPRLAVKDGSVGDGRASRTVDRRGRRERRGPGRLSRRRGSVGPRPGSVCLFGPAERRGAAEGSRSSTRPSRSPELPTRSGRCGAPRGLDRAGHAGGLRGSRPALVCAAGPARRWRPDCATSGGRAGTPTGPGPAPAGPRPPPVTLLDVARTRGRPSTRPVRLHGAPLASRVLGVERPRVALRSNGGVGAAQTRPSRRRTTSSPSALRR